MGQNDFLKDLIDASFQQEQVPAGLEERLSKAIDAAAYRPKKRVWLYVSSLAAGVAVVLSLGFFVWNWNDRQDILLADTFTPDQVDQAYQTTEQALLFISKHMNQGMAQANQATGKSLDLPVQILQKY